MSAIQFLRNAYHYLSARVYGLPFYTLPFRNVLIETTTICNRKCIYCPNYTIGRPEAKMEERVFYKIIDSLKNINYNGQISPHIVCEPLLDDRIIPFIKYMRVNLPDVHIKFFTNGDFLTIDKYLELVDAGVNSFGIAQHSKNPSKTIVEMLEYIKKHHKKLYNVRYYNMHNEFYHKHNSDGYLSNIGGTVDVKVKKRSYCHVVNEVAIDYQGNIRVCCEDYTSSVIFGNINEREISDIWYDKEYVKIRKMINNGIWPYEMCKKCTDND
jgi:radical SAM protein with 4Fe4S-binding SPASM domain